MTTRTASYSRASRSRRAAHPQSHKKSHEAVAKRYEHAETKLKQTRKSNLTGTLRKLQADRTKDARVVIAGDNPPVSHVGATLPRARVPHSIDDARKITSADLRAKSGEVLQTVLQEGAVLVTHHGRPHVVVLSVDSYRNLVKQTPAPDLTALEAGFDKLVQDMQRPEAKKAVRSISDLTPEAFRRAAHSAATGRGQG